jgi:hypothetical protein
MDPRFLDLVWRLERATASNRASQVHLELARSLRHLAGEFGKDNAAADEAYHAIQSAVTKLEGEKLRHVRGRLAKPRGKSEKADHTTVFSRTARLVRAKAYQLGIGQKRYGQHEAERLASRDFPLDIARRRAIWDPCKLRPVERRATDIIMGAPRKARKSSIESDAIALADAVIADWKPSPKRAPGRPAKSRSAMKRPAVAEVIEAVLPIIDQLAGKPSSASVINSVCAAVASAGLACSSESVKSTMTDLRRRGRMLTI